MLIRGFNELVLGYKHSRLIVFLIGETVDSGYYWRVTSRDESIVFYVTGTHEVVINEINTFIGKCARDRRGLNAGFNVITQEYTLNNGSYRYSLLNNH